MSSNTEKLDSSLWWVKTNILVTSSFQVEKDMIHELPKSEVVIYDPSLASDAARDLIEELKEIVAVDKPRFIVIPTDGFNSKLIYKALNKSTIAWFRYKYHSLVMSICGLKFECPMYESLYTVIANNGSYYYLVSKKREKYEYAENLKDLFKNISRNIKNYMQKKGISAEQLLSEVGVNAIVDGFDYIDIVRLHDTRDFFNKLIDIAIALEVSIVDLLSNS